MTNKKPSSGFVCHYCHNSRHVRWDCRKLQTRDRRFQYDHESLKSASTPSIMLVRSGKPNTCLISSSSKWVIDSGTTDHMTGNSSLFTTFQSHPSTSTVTLADESPSCVLGSGTIHLTPLITLLSLLEFSFNFISSSKLTRTLNCSIPFFPDYCLIQYLSTKRVIGRGSKSGGLYILETEVPKFVACSRVVTPFELHCCLGHPSLSVEETISSVF